MEPQEASSPSVVDEKQNSRAWLGLGRILEHLIFLEDYTRKGTICDVLPPKKNRVSISSAIVQFTNSECVEIPIAADQGLCYGESSMKAREWKIDIGHNSEFLEKLVTLHFGCKISNEQFLVLWTQPDVLVKFEMELKNMYLFFSYDCVEYKLEFSSETIFRIQLHHPRGQSAKFLLFQLRGAPRIYKKDLTIGSDWVREVDFTPSCCIGQSSSLCLELPISCALPDLHKCFMQYKENKGQFVFKRGNTFSRNSGLVPIVVPPLGIDLPYKILFKINSLVQHGCIPGKALDINFYDLVDPTKIRIDYIECALDRLFNSKECCYKPVRWFREQYNMYMECKQVPQSPAISLDEGFVYVHRVQITPCKVYFCGPEVNLSNRVLRNYPEDGDNFLRVSFVDEDLGKMRSVDLCPQSSSTEDEKRTRVYDRILSTLRDGIVIGEKKFEFLAFSSSQLRENSLWMFASRRGLSAQDIRDWMGDFSHIKNVAKYAARLGQSFSSSRETLSAGLDEIEVIPDVEIEKGGIQYCFSNGIGKISADFAEKVVRKCGKSSTPSAFQIRYGGYKGVVAIDPTSSKKLSLRKSMCKFKSHNTKVDVLAWSRYQPCFLNRQLITLLSTLGVQDHVFIKKQKQAMNQLEDILTDPLKARDALNVMFQGEATNILKKMLLCYKPNAEPFLALMLQSFCASKLVELRSRSRIFVENGRSMMGCLDETSTLKYGKVFVQCSHRAIFSGSTTSTANQDNFTIEGKVVIAKNPCLHPGDVRVLTAVDVPALHHMVDCVVFPQKGKRPHPNECSGSDLDGDVYFVSWDRDLIPPRQTQAMNYTPAPIVELDHHVTIEEVKESFINYMVNDSLGIISNAHLVFADKEPQKAMSAKCMKLAKLHSLAVDSPKTGVVVKVPHSLHVREFPDFMEKIDRHTYKSKCVIGKLFQQEVYDHDMEVDGFKDYINDAISCKREYDYKLGNLMDYYGIKTEAEILSGNITNISKFVNKRKDLDSINYAVRSLMNEAKKWFIKNLKNDDQSDFEIDIKNVYAAKASAWYHVTYHPQYWGCYNKGMARDHFLSFPCWIGTETPSSSPSTIRTLRLRLRLRLGPPSMSLTPFLTILIPTTLMASSNPVPFSVRKRAWQQSNQGLSRDNFETHSHAKLYVAQVSRTATEDVIRSLFAQFGDIVEVVMLKDKADWLPTRKFQHYFPGEANPIIVKFADGEKERLGVHDRLYVCGINMEASNKDIEEIFSPYGLVEDIYILKHSRGCGFVKFSSRDMALAAIQALNGIYIMRGCAQPLIVRFADPKKPREIERRGNYVFSSATSAPYSQEPVRLVSDHTDSIGGQNFPNASFPVQQISQPPISYLANHEPQASTVMQPTFPPLRPPFQLCRMPIQQTQITQRGSQSSQVAVTELQKQQLTQSSGQIIGQQQSSQTVSSNSTSAALPSSHEIAAPLEADGTSLRSLLYLSNNCRHQQSCIIRPHHLQSVPLVPSTSQVCQKQQELNQVQLQFETSSVVGPTCV
ncbi:hypothetical protein M0R45_005986 [Rubus argutus]|uniref:RNA-directed RNA polymerase n=1 Tax=Rubus argutus TaxID=59490 RepID=A0AAW1YPR3_RUBAR